MMQFHEKDVTRMLRACEYYKSIVGNQDPSVAQEYDKVIHKLHSYEQEMECPNCWDPTSTCEIHA